MGKTEDLEREVARYRAESEKFQSMAGEATRQLLEANVQLQAMWPVVEAARDLIGKNVTRPDVYQETDKGKHRLALALAAMPVPTAEEPMGVGNVFCFTHRHFYGRGGSCRQCLQGK